MSKAVFGNDKSRQSGTAVSDRNTLASNLIWASKKHTPKELTNGAVTVVLPAVVKVTLLPETYEKSCSQMAINTVFFVRGFGKEQRVAMKSADEKYFFSLPLESPIKFRKVFQHERGPAVLLKNLLNGKVDGELNIEIFGGEGNNLSSTPDMKNCVSYGTFRVVGLYTDTVLYAQEVLSESGELSTNTRIISVSCPARFDIATGFLRKNKEDFKQFLVKMRSSQWTKTTEEQTETRTGFSRGIERKLDSLLDTTRLFDLCQGQTMQQEEVKKDQRKKQPALPPSERKPRRSSIESPKNDIKSPVAQAENEDVRELAVYETFEDLNIHTDDFPGLIYQNIPVDSEENQNSASDDNFYLNHHQLILAAKESDSTKEQQSIKAFTANEVPEHGTYVKAIRQDSNKSETSPNMADNDEESTSELYEDIGTYDKMFHEHLGSRKGSFEQPQKQKESQRHPADTLSPTIYQTPVSVETPADPPSSSSGLGQSEGIKLPQKNAKDRRNIKDKLTGIKNSILKLNVAPQKGQTDTNLPSQKPKWTTMAQVPKSIDQLTIEQISQCLLLLNLDKYVETFKRSKMDGKILTTATKEMLMQHFQMDDLEAQQVVMFAQQGWRPE